MTLDELRKRILRNRQVEVSQARLRLIDHTFKNLVNDLGDIPVDRLTKRKLTAWANERVLGGNKKTTVNQYIKIINANLAWAAEQDLVDRAFRVKVFATPKRLPRHIPEDALQRILDASAPHWRRLWTFMVWTGLRREEAANLTWDDIILDVSQPHMRVVGKGDKERVVPLLPEAVEALDQPGRGPVFLSLAGKPLRLNRITDAFKKACKLAGSPDHHLHHLRHTAATRMLSRGVNIKIIQLILGHASMSQTLVYTEGFVGDVYGELMEKMGSQAL